MLRRIPGPCLTLLRDWYLASHLICSRFSATTFTGRGGSSHLFLWFELGSGRYI